MGHRHEKRMPVAVAMKLIHRYFATDFKPASVSVLTKEAWKLLKINA
jgi:hypothetical protein